MPVRILKSTQTKDQNILDGLIRVGEAARLLDRTRRTVYDWVEKGWLQVVIVNRGTDSEEKLFYKKQVIALWKDS